MSTTRFSLRIISTILFLFTFLSILASNAYAAGTQTISGTISLPDGMVAPAGDITGAIFAAGTNGIVGADANNMPAQADNFFTIPAGTDHVDYVIAVPAVAADAGYSVSYWLDSDYDTYLHVYGSELAASQQVDVSSESVAGINFTLEAGRFISGTISLPNTDIAPEGGIEGIISFSLPRIGKAYETGVDFTIPEGEHFTSYRSAPLPINDTGPFDNDELDIHLEHYQPGYKVSYYLPSEMTGLEPVAYYTSSGMVLTYPTDGGYVDVSTGDATGIDLTLVPSGDIPPGNEVVVTDVSIKTPPTKTVYIEGDLLDLSGLVVTLSMSDGSTQDVAFQDFEANWIDTSVLDGAVLTQDDSSIVITSDNDKSVEQEITVQPVSNFSTDTSILSATYLIEGDVIKGVPYGMSKADFLASLVKGSDGQTWNIDELSDPIGVGDHLLVVAADGLASTIYHIQHEFNLVSLDRISVNTDIGPQSVTAKLVVGDYGCAITSEITGQTYVSTPGQSSDGGYECTVTLPIYSTDGVWLFSSSPYADEPATIVTNNATMSDSANGPVRSMVVQSDGKVVIGGDFTSYNGVIRNGIARLNEDGTLDTTFQPGDLGGLTKWRSSAIALQSDGKIVVAGSFHDQFYNVVERVVRLNSNGSLDTAFTFDPNELMPFGKIYAIAVQSDDKIIVGGWARNSSGNIIERLNVNGTLDTTFNTEFGSEGTVYAIAVQTDKKILVGGRLYSNNGEDRIVRLNDDGSLDTTFSANLTEHFSCGVESIAIQSDNKILVGGACDAHYGWLNRLKVDGPRDVDFDNALQDTDYQVLGPVNQILVLANDDIIIVGGDINSNTGYIQQYVIKDGVLDGGAYRIESNWGHEGFLTVAQLRNGQILTGGDFAWADDSGLKIRNIIKLNPDLTIDDVVDITIKTPPDKTEYTEGEGLQLYGLVVTLHKVDGTTQDVSWGDIFGSHGEDFAQNGITTEKASGAILAAQDKEITISVGDNTVSQPITVGAVEPCSVIDASELHFWETAPTIDSKENLIVITHGWADKEDDPVAITMMNTMRDNICSHIDRKTTTVLTYNWTFGSGTGVDLVNGVLNDTQYYAYINAYDAGGLLATGILNLRTLPQHIHFIAHSAGSNVIQNAVYKIADHFDPSKTDDSHTAPTIHMTFLDAFAPSKDSLTVCELTQKCSLSDRLIYYTPNGVEQDYGNLYGLHGYAEQYVDSRKLAAPLELDDYTDIQLRNVVNFDVSYLDPDPTSGPHTHMWPIDFYNDSIISTEFTLPRSGDKNPFNMGFPFATENTEYQTGSDTSVAAHVGQWCIITNVSEPYRRCLDYKEDDTVIRDVVITNPDDPVHFNVPEGASDYGVDVSQFISNGTGVLPSIAMMVTDSQISASVVIPEQTRITSSDSGWNGVFSAPVITSINDLVIRNWQLDYTAIEIGSDTSNLTFDRGVRIFLPNQAGKRVGFKRLGEDFTEIDSVCSVDSQGVGDSLPPNSACVFNDGNNLIIWTKHFTTFVAYTEDETAPTTSILLNGDYKNGQYTSNVQVTLTATDEPNGSGIASTTYSLDNGVTWVNYTSPFTVTGKGVHTIQYRSTDNAGNVETVQSMEIEIHMIASRSGGGGGGSGSRATVVKTPTTVTITPSPMSGASTKTIVPGTGRVLGASTYNFTRDLKNGSEGDDVTALQQMLIDGGFLTIDAPTGYFGPLTQTALAAWQSAHGVAPAVGYFGPLTRAALNSPTSAVLGVSTASVQSLTPEARAEINNKVASLLSLVQELKKQLAVLQAK